MGDEIALPARLDEDLLFILEISQDSINNFANRGHYAENDLIMKWFNHLITVDCKTLDDRRRRNTLTCRLVNCLQTLKLSPLFSKPPDPSKELPSVELPPATEAQWGEDMDPHPPGAELFGKGGKDCRTYVSTKFLDENRGACGYIGLSAANEGDSEWVFDGKNATIREKYREVETWSEDDKKKKFCLYIIDCINAEMHGMVDPHTNKDLENVIDEFIEINKDANFANMFSDGGEDGRRHILYLIQNRLYKAFPKK